MLQQKFNPFFLKVWLYAFIILLFNEFIKYGFSMDLNYSIKQICLESFFPVFFCSILFPIKYLSNKLQIITSYSLFFSISLFSVLGFTKTLTGSHSDSTNYMLIGISFYTTTFSYLISQNKLNKNSIFYASNPLLLITGPVVLFFKDQNYKKFKNRFTYYFPFVILGIFLHQTLATPLTKTFFLISETDLVSAIVFALLFEFFVYANFCGLSLIIYGLFGIMGFKIPLNFRQPFSSTNIVDFWKGWHTSLSLVLKTLFYRPLQNKWGFIVAVFGVYLSSALWHGVSYNFVLWGVFHAFIFLITVAVLKRKIPILSIFLLFFGSIVGRLIFAESDTARLLEKLKFQYTNTEVFSKIYNLPDEVLASILLLIIFVLSEFLFQKSKYFINKNYKFYRLPIIQIILLIITLLLLSKETGISYAVYGQR